MSRYHAAHLTQDPSRAMVWKVVARYLAEFVPGDARVLEIGAGYCDWINNVNAPQRVAVDIWPEFGNFAARGVEARVLDAASELRTFGVAAFDVVLASNVLEHFAPDVAPRVVADIAALLEPGGRLILVQPNFRFAWRSYFDDFTHRTIFTDVSLPALLRSYGFTIEVVQPRFLPYSMRQARFRIRAWMVNAYLRSPIKPLAGQMLVVARKD